jgi:beta-lactam-binding protein with PASTA domain
VDPPFGFRRVEAADLVQWNGDENDPEFANLRAAVSDFVKAGSGAAAPGSGPVSAQDHLVDERVKTEAARRKTGSKLFWIAAGIIAIAAVGIIIAQWPATPPSPSQPSTGVLPSVVGLAEDAAKQLLTAKGFAKFILARRVSAEDEPGTVVQQDPAAGTNLPLDSHVRLVVATRPSRSGAELGPSPVNPTSGVLPSIVGLPEEKAKQLLTAKGFAKFISARRVSAEDEPGTVVQQDPAAGTNLPLDSHVRLVVATRPSRSGGELGPSPVKPTSGMLPNVVGLTEEAANQLLTSKGFAKLIQGRRVSAEHEPGTVVQQDPAGGTNLPLDSDVRLVVATRPSRSGADLGSAPVKPTSGVLPSVVGLSSAEARQLLTLKGFAKIIQGRRVSAKDEPGTVVQQDPAAGTNLPLDSYVRLVLATQPTRSGAELGSSGLRPMSAPQQVSPASGTVFNHYRRSTTLVWKPVRGAQGYSLEHTFLGRGEHCSSVARAGHHVANLKGTSYTFSFVGAQPGCWRAWAIDEKGNAGPKSPWWEFVYTR